MPPLMPPLVTTRGTVVRDSMTIDTTWTSRANWLDHRSGWIAVLILYRPTVSLISVGTVLRDTVRSDIIMQ